MRFEVGDDGLEVEELADGMGKRGLTNSRSENDEWDRDWVDQGVMPVDEVGGYKHRYCEERLLDEADERKAVDELQRWRR